MIFLLFGKLRFEYWKRGIIKLAFKSKITSRVWRKTPQATILRVFGMILSLRGRQVAPISFFSKCEDEGVGFWPNCIIKLPLKSKITPYPCRKTPQSTILRVLSLISSLSWSEVILGVTICKFEGEGGEWWKRCLIKLPLKYEIAYKGLTRGPNCTIFRLFSHFNGNSRYLEKYLHMLASFVTPSTIVVAKSTQKPWRWYNYDFWSGRDRQFHISKAVW